MQSGVGLVLRTTTYACCTVAALRAFSSMMGRSDALYVRRQRVSTSRAAIQSLMPIEPLDSRAFGRSQADNVVRFKRREEFFREWMVRCGLTGSLSPKIIHVAGTKGKGSVCELLHRSLVANGVRTAVFTSPHIHSVCERIRVDGLYISRQDLRRLAADLQPVFVAHPWMIFFDKLLAIALAYFGEQAVEYVVLEVGLGGRYDSTNFVESPVACAITSISLDHQEILGDTIEAIASEKAGIIKTGCPTFTTSSQIESVLDVLREEAAIKQTELKVPPAPAAVAGDRRQEPRTSLQGRVQLENASLASAILEHLGMPAKGMEDAFWPCRFEVFKDLDWNILHSLTGVNDEAAATVTSPPPPIDIVLDVAHNEDSVSKLFEEVTLRYRPDRRVFCVFGAHKDKNLVPMLQTLSSQSDILLLTRAAHVRAAPVETLRAAALTTRDGAAPRHAATVTASLEESLKHALNTSGGAVVVVCGSFAVAAEARKRLAQVAGSMLFSADDPVLWPGDEDDEYEKAVTEATI